MFSEILPNVIITRLKMSVIVGFHWISMFLFHFWCHRKIVFDTEAQLKVKTLTIVIFLLTDVYVPWIDNLHWQCQITLRNTRKAKFSSSLGLKNILCIFETCARQISFTCLSFPLCPHVLCSHLLPDDLPLLPRLFPHLVDLGALLASLSKESMSIDKVTMHCITCARMHYVPVALPSGDPTRMCSFSGCGTWLGLRR